MDAANNLSLLPWDSQLFGIPMGRVRLRDAGSETLLAVLDQARSQGLALVEAFCDLGDIRSIRSAQDVGFRHAGLKIYLSRPVGRQSGPALPEGARLELATDADLPMLCEAFDAAFSDSRYLAYPGFGPDKARSLYRAWIENAVAGTYDDECLVLRIGGRAAAMCTLDYGQNDAHIGLFAVAEGFRRAGLGLAMLEAVATRLREKSIGIMATATQGANLAAQRLYARAGFRPDALELCQLIRLDRP